MLEDADADHDVDDYPAVRRRVVRVMQRVMAEAAEAPPDAAPPATLRGDIGVDSLARFAVIIALEDEFDVEIDEASLPGEAFATIDDLAAFVAEHLQRHDPH